MRHRTPQEVSKVVFRLADTLGCVVVWEFEKLRSVVMVIFEDEDAATSFLDAWEKR